MDIWKSYMDICTRDLIPKHQRLSALRLVPAITPIRRLSAFKLNAHHAQQDKRT